MPDKLDSVEVEDIVPGCKVDEEVIVSVIEESCELTDPETWLLLLVGTPEGAVEVLAYDDTKAPVLETAAPVLLFGGEKVDMTVVEAPPLDNTGDDKVDCDEGLLTGLVLAPCEVIADVDVGLARALLDEDGRLLKEYSWMIFVPPLRAVNFIFDRIL